jgi:hypothetical protein
MSESLAHARIAGAPVPLVEELESVYKAGGRAAVVRYALRINAMGPPMQLALLFGEAGQFGDAFGHLDTAIEQRDPALVHLAVAPQWDLLRVDRRFDERLKQVGLFDAAERARHVISLWSP